MCHTITRSWSFRKPRLFSFLVWLATHICNLDLSHRPILASSRWQFICHFLTSLKLRENYVDDLREWVSEWCMHWSLERKTIKDYDGGSNITLCLLHYPFFTIDRINMFRISKGIIDITLNMRLFFIFNLG